MPSRLRSHIAERPIAWFFALSFGLSWLVWTPYVLSRNGIGVLAIDYPRIAGTTQLLGVLPGAYAGPLLSAFALTAIIGGRPGLRRWVGRVARWRVHWFWYVGVLAGVPAALTITSLPIMGDWRMPAAAVLVAFVVGMVFQLSTTGLAEEPGWRDFALPYLQPKYGPLRGTLLLGPLWGAWHLPLFFTEWGGWPEFSVVEVVEFCGLATAISVVMTWVFNRTGESLPVAALLHISVNNYFSTTWSEIFPGGDGGSVTRITLIASTVAAVVTIIATRGRLGYAPAESAPRTEDLAEA
ncbi:CPBP family intramembrane glutamic endopeptidase [Saccharopolyspora dendranthemae]|uniref:CAAX prenyl protease-like protein n=1 Tax=Saccharopolyspora dendranthemae TaxID=1181886 RepID=A0A561U8U7_9PSEU|nr:CPBP family intramembrane glutamic endopeptidase [Saccharopolyspora dendranthemae]TWF95773.1 CAAX prenyl protease-like protein [Saccharopolyspora dendranthemae]